jgi:hypothetical protein
MKWHTMNSIADIVIDVSCLHHSNALIAKTVLLRADACLRRMGSTFKYYSSLAMLVHLVRDLSRNIFCEAQRRHGDEVAIASFRRLLPKCIAGRWGSVMNVQDEIIRRGLPEMLPSILKDILENVIAHDGFRDEPAPVPLPAPPAPRRAGAGAAAAAADAAPAAAVGIVATIDEIRVEETAQHKLKLGRWRRLVLAAIQDRVFWTMVPLMQRAMQPLQHHMAFVQQRAADDLAFFENGSPLSRLITGKGLEIVREVDQSFTDIGWLQELAESAPMGKVDGLIATAVELLLHTGACYHRRFVCPFAKRLP